MNFKKFISGVSAFAIAASAFAAMAVTANASDLSGSLVTTASQVAGKIKRQWNYSKGQTEIQTGNNEAGQPYAGYAYLRMSLPAIPAGEQIDSAEFSVKIKFGSNGGAREAAIAVADGLVINDQVADGVYSYDGENTIATVNSWDGGGVSITPITTKLYAKGYAPTSYTAWDVDVSDAVAAAYANDATDITFAIYGIRETASQYPSVTTEDVALSVTTKAMGAADAINVSYKYGDTEIKSASINISNEGKVEGNEYGFATPAYIGYDGAVYATGMTRKTATLEAGTTNVEIPVTLAAADGYFFEAEGNGGNADESTNAGAYSNGKGARRLDQKQVAITVPEAGVYKVTVALVCKSSDTSKNATISAYSNAYDAEATPLWSITDTYYNAYRASKFTQEDVEIEEGGKLVFYTSDWNMGIDYILLEKTADLPKVRTAGFSFTETIEDVSYRTLYVTAKINNENKMAEIGKIGKLLGTQFTDTTANLTVFLSNIPENYTEVGVVIK